MKKLLLLAVAGIVMAGSVQPGFAAKRAKRAQPAQATQLTDYRNDPGFNTYSRGTTFQSYPSGNLPYPDRPWGAPNRN